MNDDDLFLDFEPRRQDARSCYVPIQLSIRGLNGSEYYTPIRPPSDVPVSQWGKLSNDISFKGAPTLDEVIVQIRPLLKGRRVWVWNVESEKRFLPFLDEMDELGNSYCQLQDLMLWASPLVSKRWSMKWGTWKYAKQTDAAAEFGLIYDQPGPHDARADTAMMIQIYQWLQEVDIEWHPRKKQPELSLVWDEIRAQDLNCDVEGHIPF